MERVRSAWTEWRSTKNVMTGLFLVIVLCIFSPSILNADDMEHDFLTRLDNVRVEIARKSTELRLVYTRSSLQSKQGHVDLQSKERVSIEDDKRLAEKDYEQLGKEISILETEIYKRYNGRIPAKLIRRMTDIYDFYLERYNYAITSE